VSGAASPASRAACVSLPPARPRTRPPPGRRAARDGAHGRSSARCPPFWSSRMDRRITPFSGRIAHVSLKGRIDAPLTEGEAASVAPALADLLARPGGPRDRQVIHGEALTVIDRQDGHAYVMAAKDGYCGWLPEAAIAPAFTPTHHVCTPATHLYEGPKVQSPMILP